MHATMRVALYGFRMREMQRIQQDGTNQQVEPCLPEEKERRRRFL